MWFIALTDFRAENNNPKTNTSKPRDTLSYLTRMVIEKQNEYDKNDMTTGLPFLVVRRPVGVSGEDEDLTVQLSDMMTSMENDHGNNT